MIRRMDDAPKPVNPSGWVSEGKAPSLRNVQASGVGDPHGQSEHKPSLESDEDSSEPTTLGGDG